MRLYTEHNVDENTKRKKMYILFLNSIYWCIETREYAIFLTVEKLQIHSLDYVKNKALG